MKEEFCVVVVDDEVEVRDIVALLLEHDGHSVRQCATGFEALEYLSHNRADVLFTDLRMPGMTGVQLITKVLEQDILRKDHIIAVTGSSYECPDVQWPMDREISVLFKPFDFLVLRASLANLVAQA